MMTVVGLLVNHLLLLCGEA